MNERTLEQWLKEHHRDAFMWALQCCRYNQDEAKEVLQMTYLKILEGKANYSAKSQFKTWLFSVVRNTAIDHAKKSIPFEGLDHLSLMEEEPLEIDTINYQALLGRLPERQQQVLLLAFYHSLTLTEIATVTGLHIGTIRTHYDRGKTALRDLILKEKKYEKI
jgi:RNA polymerase sigma-70 factor (ECF subfamily)